MMGSTRILIESSNSHYRVLVSFLGFSDSALIDIFEVALDSLYDNGQTYILYNP